MKKMLFSKKIYYCSICCLLFAVLFWTWGGKVNAEELKTETFDENAVLQEGGKLPKPQNNGISLFSVDDTEGAKEAIKNGLDNYVTEINLANYQISKEKIGTLFQQDILNKNPKYFYVDGALRYSYNPSSNNVVTITVNYLYDKQTSITMTEAYNREVSGIVSGVNQSWSDLEKALYVNDYLAVNAQYDITYEKHSAYNLLVDKTAVCQGYALAFLEVMNQLEIPCEIVTSDNIKHAWNAVQIGNNWYYVDVTWNDPTPDRMGRARHEYFLKSDNSFQQDGHAGTDYVFTGNLSKNDISNTKFDSYFWKDVDYAFGYYNNSWYANVNGIIKQYSGNNEGLTQTEEIKNLTGNRWMVWDSQTSYYQGNYSGFGLYLNKIYYLTPTSIYSLDCNDLSGEASEIYSLTDEEKTIGYLYGFKIGKDGGLTYGLATGPSEELKNQKEIRLHEHSYHESVTKNSGCEEAGERTYTCTSCNYKYTEIIPATGHTPGDEATCTTPQKCTVCKEVLAKAKGHNYTSKITKKSTCKEKGVRTYSCTNCDSTYTEEIAITNNHSFGEWKEEKAATCTAKGIQSRTCSICGKKETRETNAIGHKPGAAPTCTTAQSCTVCHAVLANATGHIHTKTVKKAATFTKTGTETTICSDCNTTIATKTIAKIKCKKNQIYKVGNYKYKIISPKLNGKGTVAFAGLNKNIAKVTVGNTVTILGTKFKITQVADKALKNKKSVTSVTLGTNIQSIGKEAFYGTAKLKTITIKSQKLTKVGKNAFKNIYKKAKIKVPKSKLKKYQTLLKNKGQKSTVKISK